MEKQKEIVQAIVNQRDMYRTLLAQATPLPGESSLSMSLSTSRGHTRGNQSAGGRPGSMNDSMSGEEEGEEKEDAVAEARNALEEMREQFEAYRKEKAENDSILQQQIDKLREECSEVKIERAKLASKVKTGK